MNQDEHCTERAIYMTVHLISEHYCIPQGIFRFHYDTYATRTNYYYHKY